MKTSVKTSVKTSKKVAKKSVKAKAAKKPVKVAKKVAVKPSKLPALLDRTVAGKILKQKGIVTSAGEKKTVDSTTAWAQKRGLKQIVIWGPESVRDKVRAAAKRDNVPMSTWILDAVADKLGAVKVTKSTAAKVGAKKTSKSKPKPVKKTSAKKTSEVFADDNLPAESGAESIADDEAAA